MCNIYEIVYILFIFLCNFLKGQQENQKGSFEYKIQDKPFGFKKLISFCNTTEGILKVSQD